MLCLGMLRFDLVWIKPTWDRQLCNKCVVVIQNISSPYLSVYPRASCIQLNTFNVVMLSSAEAGFCAVFMNNILMWKKL